MDDECLCAATWVGDLTFELLHEVKMHFAIAFGGAITPRIALVLTFCFCVATL